jgi:ribose/xylose/arabinose/galactoside ABC-type transport system permease subunit
MSTALTVRRGRNLVAPLCLLVTFVFFSLTTEGVFSPDNLLNVGGQAAPLGIVAFGQLVVILTGGFDISVGSVAALSAVSTAMAVNEWGPVGLLVGPVAGLMCGVVNGVVVGFFRIQPIVATLGMLSVAQGLAILLSDERGVPVDGTNPLSQLGYGRVLGVPTAFWLLLAGCAVLALVLRHLRMGRRVYMVGSNREGARLSGVGVPQTLVFAYAISGLSAGIAALVYVGRAGAGLPTEGAGLELQAIAAVVVGGAALTGGVGRPLFVLFGALFIQLLGNGLNLAGTSPFEQEIVLGGVLLVAGLLDFTLRRFAAPSNRPKGTP